MGSFWLLWQSSLLSLAGPLIIVAQIACAIHVIKTGRPYWWLWIILCFPLIGLAAYVYLEVRPSLGKPGFQALLWNLKSSAERIRILEHELEESTTVRNRLSLADELHAAGKFDRECDVLSEGLRGAFKDDATLLMRLSEAHLEAGRTLEAQKTLEKAVPEKSPDAQLQFALLKARVSSYQGNGDAETLFKETVARKRSEGARYYYADHMLRTGRRDEAATILKDILYQYRRGTVVWRFQERKWYYAAKRLLKSRPTSAR